MNICESVITGAKLFPEHDAIIFEKQRLTYAQLERLSSRAAAVLQEQGVARGDRVGLVLPNAPAFAVWYYAVLRLGGVAVSVSTRLAPKEVAFILSDCQAQVVVATPASVDAVRTAQLSAVSHVLVVSESGDDCQGEPLQAKPCLAAPHWMDTEPHEPAVILYTSGTTGFPKGATLSHQNVRATVHAFNHLCEMRGDDRLLLCVPLFHCYGQNALLNAGLQVGATLIMQQHFDLNESKHLIIEHEVTKLFGVPTTFQLLWESCEPYDLRSVGYCFSAAATMPIQLSQRWHEKFGMPIYEGYGLTETAPFASYNHHVRYVAGSVGTPVDLVEMKIVDTDTGHTCSPGELGEIVIRGPNVMLGYWNRPEETAAAIRNGWFHSGDIGRMDAQGYFYIVDRLKDMISIGGTKIFPAEVERVLLDHPAVSEAAVVGFPEPLLGERAVAFVVSSEPVTDAHAIQLHCQKNLAAYKVPRQIAVVEQLPRNPTGKVLKTRLREWPLSELPASPSSATATPAGPIPTETTGGLPAVPHAAATVTGNSPNTSFANGFQPLAARLHEVHAASRLRVITALIQDELKDMTATDETADPQQLLVETGLDSLMFVELRDRLQRHVGEQFELPATLVFDHPRICDLAAFLIESLECGRLPASGATASSNRLGTTTASADVAAGRESAESLNSADELPADIEAMSEQQAIDELLREVNED